MTVYRRFTWLCVGLLFGAFASYSYADTFPATVTTTAKTTRYYLNNLSAQAATLNYATVLDAASTAAALGVAPASPWVVNNAAPVNPNGSAYTMGSSIAWQIRRTTDNALIYDTIKTAGGGTYSVGSGAYCAPGATVSGANCISTTCPAGSTGPTLLNGVQTCTSLCNAGTTFTGSFFGGWRVGKGANAVVGPSGGPYTAPVTQCNGSCVFTSDAATCTSSAEPFVDTPQAITCTGTLTQTGASCTVDNTATPTTAPTIPNHTPKCLATEGVLTSSSGTVACVPAGVPSSTPVVSEKKTTTTYPDGSKAINTVTTTTDPASGATNVGSTTSTTGTGGSGSTVGQAGPIGTTTSGTDTGTPAGTANDKAKDQQGDCTLEPDAPFCKPFVDPGNTGLYEKKSKSVGDVLGTFKTGVMSSQIGTAGTAFFTVSVPSGTCPAWAVDVPVLNVHLDISQYFCTATAQNMMNLVGAVLIFVAAFVGFRWAIL